MTPTDVLRRLTEQGVVLVADGERLRYRPREAVTDDLRDLMVTYKADLLQLLSAEESEIAWRVEAMRGQYRPGVGFPFLVARRDFVDAPGHCLSCGEPHGPGRRFRCSSCVRAVEIVINEVLEGNGGNGTSLCKGVDHGD